MKKQIIILFFMMASAMSAMAQTDSVSVWWNGESTDCFCQTTVTLNVCWCTMDTFNIFCLPGTEACNTDTTTILYPSPTFNPKTLNVPVPSGAHVYLRQLILDISCYGTVIFDLTQPDGVYQYPTIILKPGCPPLTITKSGNIIKIFSGN